ncbi:GIY-YIG nuclease family protein [Methanobacterium sp. ACI-7]|uniref:GIY-YIG nuclease family protein n=1 Tax=unclassified Methanobacterium TaxID=2627676 RepID=UPI0039C186A6
MATYCLIIKLSKNSIISVGKLEKLDFKKGYYVYVGSALNSIDARVKRHLKSEKKLFWHIDYLLNSPKTSIKEIILERSPYKWECKIAEEVSKKGKLIDKFGCSDCSCNSHLLYFKNFENTKEVVLNSFNKYNLDVEEIKNNSK